MRRLLADIPRPVLISLAVLAAVLVLVGILVPLLGGALDDAVLKNRKLKADIQKATKSIEDIKTDQQFVLDHQERFEDLLQNGRLIPHTRRSAALALQDVAREKGLTALSYSFGSAASALSSKATQSQPGNDAYRVSIEDIDLKFGAPTDGDVFRYVDGILTALPGSAVLQTLTVARAPKVTDEALKALSQGQDARLVTAEARVSWRTAQAQEQKPAEKKGK